MHKGFDFSAFSQNLLPFVLWVAWGGNLLWLWFAIRLRFRGWVVLRIFSCAWWSFVYHLWRNVCLSLFPIFKSGYLTFCCCWVVRVLFVFCIWKIYDLQVFFPHPNVDFSLSCPSWTKLSRTFSLSVFAFAACACGVILKKSLPQYHEAGDPFRVHFYVWRQVRVQIHSSACASFPNAICWRDCRFPIEWS